MRKIITTTFVTMDGVMQAPGGPDEDRDSGFASGGWSFGWWDKTMRDIMTDFMSRPFELLLGRKTYDIFAAYWPKAQKDQVVAVPFNTTRKYVVSHDAKFALTWENSTLITGDAVSQIRKLKEDDGPDLWVHGSGNLIQTLLSNNLIDRMHIWMFPVTVGAGKRLFAEGSHPAAWKLVDFKTATTGVIIATYEPAGQLKTGTLG